MLARAAMMAVSLAGVPPRMAIAARNGMRIRARSMIMMNWSDLPVEIIYFEAKTVK